MNYLVSYDIIGGKSRDGDREKIVDFLKKDLNATHVLHSQWVVPSDSSNVTKLCKQIAKQDFFKEDKDGLLVTVLAKKVSVKGEEIRGYACRGQSI